MLVLKPDECRVLGVLIEKAQSTPQQYPLTLNALVSGCNQKNNRLPVVEWDEERVYDAIDTLRAKRLVNEVNLTGSRVPKFKHNARETLSVDTPQLVILAELLLRGPQTLGELRTNASRMHPLESLDVVQSTLQTLMAPQRTEPLVQELPPPPGSRAKLFVQLICPGLHAIPSVSAGESSHAEPRSTAHAAGPSLVERVARLEAENERLRAAIATLADSAGLPNPLG